MKFYLGNKYAGAAQCALVAVSSAVQASSFKGSGLSGDDPSNILTIIFSIIGAIIALVIVVYIVRNLPSFNIKVKSDYVYKQGVLVSKNGEPIEGASTGLDKSGVNSTNPNDAYGVVGAM